MTRATPNENEISHGRAGGKLIEVASQWGRWLVKAFGVGFIKWLGTTGAKRIFQCVMSFIKQLAFFRREIVAAEALHIFERIEELVFLIGVSDGSRISA